MRRANRSRISSRDLAPHNGEELCTNVDFGLKPCGRDGMVVRRSFVLRLLDGNEPRQG